MPEICRFYGIIIAMFGDDHNPRIFTCGMARKKVVSLILLNL